MSFVHSRQHALIDSKGHSWSNQCQGQVGHHGDDGDILDSQKYDKYWSKSDARISWILPIDQMLLELRSQPHFVDLIYMQNTRWRKSSCSTFVYSSRKSLAKKSCLCFIESHFHLRTFKYLCYYIFIPTMSYYLKIVKTMSFS